MLKRPISATLGNVVRDVRYPAIDGIRWYAAFIVFFVHATLQVTSYLKFFSSFNHTELSSAALNIADILHRGQYGVDVFFIISGFLMGRIIAARGDHFSYFSFIRSRFVRIYPAFLITYLICAAYFPLHYDAFKFSLYSFFANLLFLNALPSLNIVPYNYVSWSLGFEFAFYLIIPLVILFRRYPPKAVASVALVLAALFIHPPAFRMQGLFIGFFISAWSDNDLKRIAARIPLWQALTAYAAIVILYRTSVLDFGLMFYRPFIVVAGILFVKIAFDNNWLHRFFSRTPMRVLGTISYSFYLIHPFCLSVTSEYIMHALSVQMMPTWFAVATYLTISMILALVCAMLIWYFFERPYFAKKIPTTESLWPSGTIAA